MVQQKRTPYYSSNFVYCRPTFIILGVYTVQEICNWCQAVLWTQSMDALVRYSAAETCSEIFSGNIDRSLLSIGSCNSLITVFHNLRRLRPHASTVVDQNITNFDSKNRPWMSNCWRQAVNVSALDSCWYFRSGCLVDGWVWRNSLSYQMDELMVAVYLCLTLAHVYPVIL